MSSGAMRFTTLIGIAKPTPSLPPDCDRIDELTPITWPAALNSGPPELPGLIAASVWMAPRADDPLRYCLLQPQWRADCDRCFADGHLVGVAQGHRLDAIAHGSPVGVGCIRVNLDDSQIVQIVAADQLRWHRALVLERHGKLVSILHDVIVRHDAASRVDDEA